MKSIFSIIPVLFVLLANHTFSQQVYEADNGITASGSGTTRKVSLGGALTGNTSIPLGGFNLNLTGDGYFGIGTNSPITRFHLYKSINSDFSPLMTLEDDYSDGFTMMQFRATNHIYNIGAGNGNWFNLQNDFFIWDETNTAARLVISETGNVGIGINDPTNRLSIAAASAGSSGLQFTQLNSSSTAVNGNGKVLGLDASGNVILVNDAGAGNSWALAGNSGTTPGTDFLGTTDNQRLVFKTNNTEQATILESGNVGIGISNPLSKLHLNGAFRITHPTFTGHLTIDHVNNNTVRFSSFVGSFMTVGPLNTVNFEGQQVQSNVRGAQFSNTNAGYSLQTVSGNVALNTTDGNTLIGTTTDNGQKLQVNGAVRFEDQLSVIKPYVADAKVMDIGRSPNVNSNLSLVYGSTNDFITLNVGSTLALKRNGGGNPSIASSQAGMTILAGDHVDFITNSGAPAELRITGNYGLGQARFGAYNPATGFLMVGNSYNNYEFIHHTRFKNGTIQIVDLNGQIQAILNEEGELGLGMSNPTAQLHTTGTVRFAGLTNNDALTQVLATDANGNVSWRNAATLGSANAWVYGGNNVGSASMIGNTSAQNLQIITDNSARITIHATNGNVGIGTESISDAAYKLYVEGSIRTRKVRVDQSTWADFVFYPGYNLRPLAEVEQYIASHKHLPDVPSAAEVEKEGIDLGDNQAVLLRKIEELTLYIIEQNKRMEEQEKRIRQLEQQVQNK